jgi:hypothetical protein
LGLPRPGETAIPNSLLTNPAVSSNAIRLFGVMVALTCPAYPVDADLSEPTHKVAFATPRFAQRDLPLYALQSAAGPGSDKTVRRALDELVRLGYVTEERPTWREWKTGKLRKILHVPTAYHLHPNPTPPAT